MKLFCYHWVIQRKTFEIVIARRAKPAKNAFLAALLQSRLSLSFAIHNHKKGEYGMSCGACNTGTEKELDFSLLAPVLTQYKNIEGSLITILQKAQEIYGYLPTDLLQHISKETGIKPAKIMGVVSFYSQFRTRPVGRHIISLCQGTACHVLGSVAIERVITEYLGIKEGETTADNLFTLTNVACLGCCSLAPAMMIGSETYGNLTPESTRDILKQIRDSTN